MPNDKEQIVETLNEMIQKPGGKQATRFVLNALGAIPYVGGVIAGAGEFWGEKEQQSFNTKIIEWVTQTDADLSKILELLSDHLRESTRAHMALLIGEVTGVDIQYQASSFQISVILNGETVGEFRPYVQNGWMSLNPNGNIMCMGAGNRIGNSVEDKRRPWGMGSGFVLSVSAEYFSEDQG